MTAPAAPAGPFETPDEVRDLPEVRAAWDAVRRSPGQGHMQRHGQAIIAGACQRAGVELGAQDRHVLHWLAGIAEPEQCAVIAAIITRAARANGMPAAAEDATDEPQAPAAEGGAE